MGGDNFAGHEHTPGQTRVSSADIVKGLRDLGLPESAVVLVHSSLSRFGHVEGGAEAVVDALLETVGPRIQEWAKIELLYGRTTMGGLVEDALCGVDYLVNHCPDVDGEAIGMTGFSLGGIVAFYAAVVDPADLLGAIVPRALLVIGAEEDVGMPVEALREMENRGHTAYEQAGRPKAFQVHIEAGGHNLRPEGLGKMAEWFDQHLS